MIQLFSESDLLELNVLFPELADQSEADLLALVDAFDRQMDGELERGVVRNPKHRLIMTASYYYNCLLTEWNAKSYVGLPAKRAEANERAQRHFGQRHTLLHMGWLMIRSELGIWSGATFQRMADSGIAAAAGAA